MDQCRSRPKLSENFERHWSIQISGKIHMDQSLVHTFSFGNSYGPMVLKVLQKFPPTLVLVHGRLFPVPMQIWKMFGNNPETLSEQTLEIPGISWLQYGWQFPSPGEHRSFDVQTLGVLSHHLNCEMKSPHLVDFS